MKKAGSGQKEQASQKRVRLRKLFPAQPQVKQKHACQVSGKRIKNHDLIHGHGRKQAAQENIRPQIPVVGKLKAAAPSAQSKKIGQQRLLFQTGVPNRLGEGSVLAEPVGSRAVHAAGGHGQKDKQEKQPGQQQRADKFFHDAVSPAITFSIPRMSAAMSVKELQ